MNEDTINILCDQLTEILQTVVDLPIDSAGITMAEHAVTALLVAAQDNGVIKDFTTSTEVDKAVQIEAFEIEATCEFDTRLPRAIKISLNGHDGHLLVDAFEMLPNIA